MSVILACVLGFKFSILVLSYILAIVPLMIYCGYTRVGCNLAIRECMVAKGQYIIQPCNLQSVL